MLECYCCKKQFEKVENHHLNYTKNITIKVCKRCHEDIHHTNKWLDLKPVDQSPYDKNRILIKGDREIWLEFAIAVKRNKITIWDALKGFIIDYTNKK